MAIWTVSNMHKKSCEEHMIWTKDNRSFKIIDGFRWGTFSIETNDNQPPLGIDPKNPNGINMYEYSSDNVDNGAQLEMMDDGWYNDFDFDSDEFSEEEQEELMALWEEDSFTALEEAGWSNDENEAWLFGPLEIKNQDTGETIRGEEPDTSNTNSTTQTTQSNLTDWPFPNN
jgi:hypothetical protein